jgi:CRP-like cAMP-binding protein
MSVRLELGLYLQHNGVRTEWVYLPTSSLLSMICTNAADQSVETSMAGNEGVAGLQEACGSQVSGVDCVVQVDGLALRAPGDLCRTMAMTNPSFSASAWKIVELQLLESRQSALCHAMHSVEQRFARWMLESMDRSGGRNPLPMTQEFLAAMLGVQRTTVSTYAAQIQREGVISYKRGRLAIVQKAKLEALSCECRRIVQEGRERLDLIPLESP